jgi:high-affinity iron transporter
MKAVRFNVAWNIWREVAECGVFLIPFFLSGEDLQAIPLSAVVGSAVGCLMGWAIYVANRRLRDTRLLAFFIALLLLVLSAGLWTGGAHNLELQWYTTRTLWSLKGDFWSIDRLPMTVLKPFGYNDSRTIMETCTYWSWLGLGVFLHVRKYKRAPKRLSRPRATLLTQAHPATTEDAP